MRPRPERHNSEPRAAARDRREAARRLRRRKDTLLVAGMLLVVAIVAATAMLWPGDGAKGQADAAPVKAVKQSSSPADAHPEGKDCSSCHETPEESHFSADCASCHTSAKSWNKVQLAHVTFGKHTRSDGECSDCHTGQPATEIACLSCHAGQCGESAKTVGDCIECHRKGTTKQWVPQQ